MPNSVLDRGARGNIWLQRVGVRGAAGIHVPYNMGWLCPGESRRNLFTSWAPPMQSCRRILAATRTQFGDREAVANRGWRVVRDGDARKRFGRLRK